MQWWSVKGPEIIFMTLVTALVIGVSVWQFIVYLNNSLVLAALGWGVILAKVIYNLITYRQSSNARFSDSFPLALFTRYCSFRPSPCPVGSLASVDILTSFPSLSIGTFPNLSTSILVSSPSFSPVYTLLVTLPVRRYGPVVRVIKIM